MEEHVDAAVGGQQIPVADARAQEHRDALDPVRRQLLGLDSGAAHAVAVGVHGDRGGDHRHRVAMRHRKGRVGEGRDERSELLEVLRRFQHPPVRTAEVGERAENSLQVRVVRPLVETEVEVAPPRHAREPLERVRREVEVFELDLLLDRVRVLVVHRAQQRHHRHLRLVAAAAAFDARVDVVRSRAVAGEGHRLEALPVGERPQSRIGRDEVDEVRRPRPRESDHDDRRRDGDVVDLGMPAVQILDEQAAAEQAHGPLTDREPSELVQTGVGFDRGDHRPQPRQEVVGAEVVEAGAGASRIEQRAFVERDVERRAVVEGRALRVVEPWLAQVVDVDHWTCVRSSRFRVPLISPSSQLVSQKLARPCSSASRSWAAR